MTVPKFRAAKGAAPLVCLTAYTTPVARIVDRHVDLILVGDSLGMVVHGLSTTVGVTLDMMIMHGKAVMRGSEHALVVVDMPFGTYEESPAQAHVNAVRVMQETGCNAVKLEGGTYMAPTIAFLVERGIPVMGHIGLMPQSVQVTGGFRARGRVKEEWAAIEQDALAVSQAGAFAVVLEGVTEPLAARLTKAVTVPTIGIGASKECDGQILVCDDMLGLSPWTPGFVKGYADLEGVIDKAVADYAADVRQGRYPAEEHTYKMKDDDKKK
jgi:3-methyl-2-oxobutanoate hydroxymethyltransferase